MTDDGILALRITPNSQSQNPRYSIGDIAITQPEDTKEIESDSQYITTLENQKIGNIVAPDALTERTWRRRRRIQFLTLCWVFILEGWNDSSIGPLLDRIQGFYRVNYATVSLVFVFACVGFMFGAILNVYMVKRFGFGKTIVVGTIGQMIAYALIIPAPPFPVIVLAFGTYSFSTSMQNSQVNSFVAGMNDPSKMAILHAVYGTGAFSSPFVSTQFSTMKHWSFYYFTTLGLAISATIALLIVFKLRSQDELLASCGIPVAGRAGNKDERNLYRQLFGTRVVYPLALFALAYCGIEITIGGWIVNYLIRRTGGGPSSGYASSGFFAGLAIGRLILLWVNKKLGERRVIFLYTAIAIGLEIFIWALPLLIPSAVAVALVGVVLGPMFPILMNQCGGLLPSHLLSGAIGSIVSAGMVGGAILPFMTGALTDHYGVTSLQPLLIAMMVFMALMWTAVVYDNRKEASRALKVSQEGTPKGIEV